MKGLQGIGGTANTLAYKNRDTYEGPWGIGGTANTLRCVSRDSYEEPPAIGGTANTFRCFNINLQFHIQRVLAVPPIPQGLCQVEINSRVNFEIMIHV